MIKSPPVPRKVRAIPGNDEILEVSDPSRKWIVSTLLDTILVSAPGMHKIMLLICCNSKLDARRPVEKIAVTEPGTASANAATNIATACHRFNTPTWGTPWSCRSAEE